MKKKLIVITGTPGSGKSTFAVSLSKKLGFDRLEVCKYYKKISVKYDRSKKCYDIDMKKFKALVARKLRESERGLIVDSHIAHLLPSEMVNLCVVMVCSNLKKLEKRLVERKYSVRKVRENIDSEIFQVCLHESKEKGHNVLVIDSGKRFGKKEVLNGVTKLI